MDEEEVTIDQLITEIQDENPKVRTNACLKAPFLGAEAIKPLAALMDKKANHEVALAAMRGIDKIVHHAGRPGADDKRKAVTAALLTLLDEDQSPWVRREALWWLGEIAGDEAVEPIAKLLTGTGLLEKAKAVSASGDPRKAFAVAELREYACMALERIPGQKSLAALEAALTAKSNKFPIKPAQRPADKDFGCVIAQALRARGVRVEGYPCQKLVPSKEKRTLELKD